MFAGKCNRTLYYLMMACSETEQSLFLPLTNDKWIVFISHTYIVVGVLVSALCLSFQSSPVPKLVKYVPHTQVFLT